MHIDIGFEPYLREVSIILANLSMSYEWQEIKYLKEDWENLVLPLSKDMSEDNARKVRSVLDRAKSGLGEVNDTFMNVI